MPLFYLRRLTSRDRTERGNRHLARYLAFVAGAADAGGWMAVRHYSSHMSGIISKMANDLALGSLTLFRDGLASLLAFFLGAICTTVCVRWARSRQLDSEYALPLLLEAALLLVFGLTTRSFTEWHLITMALLLCFTMGLQNATITKISDCVIRTTHLTGMVTDIGIAAGRILHAILTRTRRSFEPEMSAIRLLGSLIGLFLIGGVIGVTAFQHVGTLFALPLAAILVLLAAMPIVDDVRRLSNPVTYVLGED